MKRAINFEKLIFAYVSVVIIFFLLSPTLIFLDPIFFSSIPSEIRYPLWLSGLNIFDYLLAPIAVMGLISNFFTKFSKEEIILIFSAFLAVLFGLFLQLYNGYSLIYYDGLLYFYRAIIFLLIIKYFFEQNLNFFCGLLIACSAILTIISIYAVLFEGYSGVFGGRINFIGMGPNVSADFLLFTFASTALLYKYDFIKKIYPILALLLCIAFIPMTGSRRAILGLLLLIFYFEKKYFFQLLILIILALIIAANYFNINILNYEDILFVNRLIELYQQVVAGSVTDGRLEMYANSFSLLKKYPFGLGISDWAIQEGLQIYGSGSHSHNFFLQMYLKFGVASIVFILIILKTTIRGIMVKFSIPLFFLLINISTGYGFWNLKYIFAFIFLIYSINFVYENSRKS